MSAYWTDFTEYTTGVPPSDWTERWVSGNWKKVTSGTLYYDTTQPAALLRDGPTGAGAGWSIITWDDIGTPSGDVELLIRTQKPSGGAGSGVVLRATGGVGTETGYCVRLRIDFFDPNVVQLFRLNAGASSLVDTGTGATGHPGRMWIRTRLTDLGGGSVRIRVRAWAIGTSEPSTWSIDYTDASALAAGPVGCLTYDDKYSYIYRFSCGTGGDAAPMEPDPTLVATALDSTTIQLEMGAGPGAVNHYLYRSTTDGFTPSVGTLIATYGATPPATLDDTGLTPGTRYYYVLRSDDGAGGTADVRADARTDGVGEQPSCRVGVVTDTTAELSTDFLSEYLEVRFQTEQAGSVIDDVSLTGSERFFHALSGLSATTEYVARCQVRYAAGWSDWSDDVTFTTFDAGYGDPDFVGCPPSAPGVVINPDANPPDNRIGLGFYSPTAGEPLSGETAQIEFRWTIGGIVFDFEISDDQGVTWSPLLSGVERYPGVDGDGLVRYRATFDTTVWNDGPDYRLKAIFTNKSEPDVESLCFPIDNDGIVKFWRMAWGDLGDRWGKMWAQDGKDFYGNLTNENIWYHAREGSLCAIRGHQHALLADLECPTAEGFDATIRFHIWSGEGGWQTLQGRDDTEGFVCGVGLFGEGATEEDAKGLFVGVHNVVTWPAGCCANVLTSSSAAVGYGVATGSGFGATTVGSELGGLGSSPINKMWFKKTRLPKWHGFSRTEWRDILSRWPVLQFREGPRPGDAVASASQSCGRRWEIYALRVRAEIDPGDSTQVRIRMRLDGLGVEEPATGYWHEDETITVAGGMTAGAAGLMSYQLATATYGQPNGARMFLSSSFLPITPGAPPNVVPLDEEIWNPLEEGRPCSVILQVYDEDRKRVRWEVGTDPDHVHPFLLEPANYGEQELDVVNGAATIGQAEVVIVDRREIEGDQDSGWVTKRLGGGSTESAVGIHGHRCRLLRFIDYRLGWVVIADGPAGTPRLDESYAAYTWTIRDTRETERKVRAFVEANSCWLLPMGVEQGFGRYDDEDGNADWLIDPATPLTGTFSVSSFAGSTWGRLPLDSYWTPGIGSGNTVDEDAAMVPKIYDAMLGEKKTIGGTEILGGVWPYEYTWPDLEILWRPAGSGARWSVVQPYFRVEAGWPVHLLPPGSLSGPKIDAVLADGTEVLGASWVMIQGNGATGTFPSHGDSIEVAVRRLGEPSEECPLHIEGLTPGQFLKRGYDGEFSAPHWITGEPVPTGIRYNELDLMATGVPADETGKLRLETNAGDFRMENDSGDLALEIGSLSPYVIRLRQTEVVDDFREWTEEHIYSPIGWVPALNNDGEISPKSQIPPDTTAGLFQVTDAITEPQPDWDAGERIINILEYNYPRWYLLPMDKADAADLLEEREVLVEYRDESSITRHADQRQDYDGQAFSAVGDTEGQPFRDVTVELGYQLSVLRKLYVFDRYRNGAATLSVPVRRDYCYTERAGNFVVVDLSWFPDYVTQRRGLVTMGQILAIYDVDCEWRILLIEEVLPLIPES